VKMSTQTDDLHVNPQQDTTPTSSNVSEHMDFYWVRPFNCPYSNPEIGRPRRASPDTSPINTKSPSRGASIHPFSTCTDKKVTKLCGHEPLTKYLTLAVVTLQFLVAIHLRSTPFVSLRFFLTAYLIGATANQNLFLAIHEISHNLAFKSPLVNRYFAVFANLPIGLPYSAAFRPYHLEHHKFLGIDGIDTDLPTRFEALFLQNVLGKAFFWYHRIFALE
jgi:fatty acid desaturase